MTSQSSTDPIISAHKHSSSHRDEIMASDQCGCFYCVTVFKPDKIVDWIDEVEGIGTTAMCPHCGIDSVIGSASGFPITPGFLGAMKAHWF